MNLFSEIHDLVIEALWALQSDGVLPSGLDFANVAVEPPRDALHCQARCELSFTHTRRAMQDAAGSKATSGPQHNDLSGCSLAHVVLVCFTCLT